MNTNTNSTKSIDRSKLLDRCLGIDTFADKIATAFVATLPKEREVLRSAVASSDWMQVAKHAHRLRGSASNVCAEELSKAAAAVENAARHHSPESTLSLIENIENAIDQILNEQGNGVSEQ